MNIESSEFTLWVEGFAPGATLKEICTEANLSLSTISEQRSGQRITPKTIIAIARAYRLNPGNELATFSGYESLAKAPLTLVDAAPFYSALELLHQWFVRKGKSHPGLVFAAPEAKLKRWIDVNRKSATQRELAQHLTMQPSNFSQQIKDGTLSIPRIIELATYLGTSPLPGLVAAGYMLFEEVFSQNPEDYLIRRPDNELLSALVKGTIFLPSDITHIIVP
ncbi:hypothetical protein ACN08Y_10000 [Rothia sp. P5764]|uniref:hypothetical protein n=1 Tax=Rothia sp. P5764 TaxID=3402654 RepID=UPI003ACCDA05